MFLISGLNGLRLADKQGFGFGSGSGLKNRVRVGFNIFGPLTTLLEPMGYV